MTITYGLTSAGLRVMTESEIRADMNARIWRALVATLDLSDRSLEGQLVAIISEGLGRLNQLTERVYAAFNVQKAVDYSLDQLCLITGTRRKGAAKSTVMLTLTGTDGTPVPTDSIARITGGAQFETLEDTSISNSGILTWTVATLYTEGDRATAINGTTGPPSVFRCTTTGTSDVTGDGPALIDPANVPADPSDIVDGTAHWEYLGAGTAAVDVAAQCTETGPTVANSLTITDIVTPIGGWDGVTNINPATVGRNQMTNAELRILRELELGQPGTSPADAIRAAALEVTGVTNATVFVNNTDTTDGDGMPPHSVEVMVQGGDDQDIYDMLRDNVAAGIQTHGTEVGSSTDSQGTVHVMKFTRPTEITIYVAITIVKDPVTYPADGDDQVKQAIVDWGDLQATGKNAVSSRIGAASFDVDGVLEVTTCFIKTSATPTLPTTIAISLRELATYAVARIGVTSSDGVP